MKKRLVFMAIMLIAATAQAAPIACGIGQSESPDPAVAGKQAADQAKKGLGHAKAKIVIVFAARSQVNANLVDGITSVFDRSIVYGCEGYSPVTQLGNFADQGHGIRNGVSVLALGGDMKITVAVASTQMPGKHKDCGMAIGKSLLDATRTSAAGKLIATFGDQHVGQNQPFIDGLHSVIDKGLPVVGAAAGGGNAKEIVNGNIVTHTNIAILIAGSFRVQVATNGGGGDLVAKTSRSFRTAFKRTGAGKPCLAFVFDCGGRRGSLVKQKKIIAEYEVMKQLAGACPFFGFYGGGEIGPPTTGQPSKGVGFNVATAAIWIE